MSKIKTAKKTSKVGSMDYTFNLLIAKITPDMWQQLTGKQLGKLVDMLYDQKVVGSDEMFREFNQ